jgi:hypothetical protein
MVKSTRLAASASTVLLTLTTGCSQGDMSQDTSVPATPEKLTGLRPSLGVSKAESPTPSPTTLPDHFQDGLDAGMSAATITQSARSKDDWNLVISRWQSAIDLLKAVSKSSPNYAKAQHKIPEYQRNLTYAQKQNNIPPKSKIKANASPLFVEAASSTSPSSVTAEVALAQHLRRIGAKLYGTYWCSYCHRQKALFGQEAFSQIDYIECDLGGKDARPNLCRQADVTGFPTWEIKGKQYGGLRSLQDLADLSGYQGDRNFKN